MLIYSNVPVTALPFICVSKDTGLAKVEVPSGTIWHELWVHEGKQCHSRQGALTALALQTKMKTTLVLHQ